jgi:hypothetical protein
MAYSVPTKNSAIDAGKTNVVEGMALGLGESMGRSILGPGLGTALGGIAIASAQSGAARDRMAMVAGERAANEIFAGGGGGGGGSSSRGSI